MLSLLLAASLAAGQDTPLRAALETAVQGQPSEDADGDFKLHPKETVRLMKVDSGLWRSGQPDLEGLRALAQAGVKTVLSLREKVDEEERREAKKLGMTVESVPILGFLMPTFSQVDRARKILEDPAKRPAAVHCRYGKDRTGTVVAAYKVMKGVMTPEEAAAEAKTIGCCPSGYRDLTAYLREYAASRRTPGAPAP